MSEESEQIALFVWASYAVKKYPELRWMHHIPNGGKRDKATAAKLKAMGVKKGIPDVFLPVPRHGFFGLYIEMKSKDKHSKPTEEQIECLSYMGGAGYMAVICKGWDAARETIENYLGDKHEKTSRK